MSYPKQNIINQRGEVLQTSVLGLKRTITKADFRVNEQKMTIKCVASIYEIYYKHVEITAILKPRRKHKRRQDEMKHRKQDNEGNDHEGD